MARRAAIRTRNQLLFPGGLDWIECKFVGREGAGEVIYLIPLWRMRGVEFAPVGLGPGPSLLSNLHWVAAPIDGQSGVAALCVGDYGIQRGGLAAAVDVEDGGEVCLPLGEGVEGGDFGGSAFKRADFVCNDSADEIVLFPMIENFRLKRIAAGIEIGPQLGERSWDFSAGRAVWMKEGEEREEESGERDREFHRESE